MAVWRVILSGTMLGQLCQNVMHFARDDTFGFNQVHLAERIATRWADEIRSRISNNATISQVEVKRIDIPDQVPHIRPINTVGASASGLEANPYSCFKLKLVGPSPGRQFRGRIYVWGLNPADMNFGFIRNAVVLLWQGSISVLMQRWGPGGTEGYQLVIAPRDNPTNFKAVVDMRLASVPGVQRRRNIGVGR